MKNFFALIALVLGFQWAVAQEIKLPMFYNVYYDFNQANIRPSAEDTLKMVLKTLQDNPKLIVEVRGHTDAIGGTAYNNRLSARRAQTVINYLTANGIEKDRLVLRAFGKMEPVAENTVDGKDNPEGRQLNRRVEFKVIGTKNIEKQQSSTAPKSTTGLTLEAKEDQIADTEGEELDDELADETKEAVVDLIARQSLAQHSFQYEIQVPAQVSEILNQISSEREEVCPCNFPKSRKREEWKVYRRATLRLLSSTVGSAPRECYTQCLKLAHDVEQSLPKTRKNRKARKGKISKGTRTSYGPVARLLSRLACRKR